METYFFEVFGNNFIEAFISSKNPFDILTFMASEAVIYDSMI
jgi:hypothetical protein